MASKDELLWLEQSKDLSSVNLAHKNHSSSVGGVSSFMGGICGKRK